MVGGDHVEHYAVPTEDVLIGSGPGPFGSVNGCPHDRMNNITRCVIFATRPDSDHARASLGNAEHEHHHHARCQRRVILGESRPGDAVVRRKDHDVSGGTLFPGTLFPGCASARDQPRSDLRHVEESNDRLHHIRTDPLPRFPDENRNWRQRRGR